MSSEVPPVGGTTPVPAPAPASRPEKPQAVSPGAGDAVHVDTIPSSPPPELRDEIAAAAHRADELRADGRELHFSFDQATQRVQIEVKDLDGNVLRTIPPSKALSVISGGKLD